MVVVVVASSTLNIQGPVSSAERLGALSFAALASINFQEQNK
jgi:hypothetical protein